jgi:hypothetical protein
MSATNPKRIEAEAAGTRALSLVEEAIALLDEANYPGEIAAHLDLARHRLCDVLGVRSIDEEGLTTH